MPCYNDPDDYKIYEAMDNEKKYGIKASNEEMYKAIACEMGKALANAGHLHHISEGARKWFADHIKADAAKTAKPKRRKR